MTVLLGSFIATAANAQNTSRIVLDEKNPGGDPLEKPLATGCFACIRNKLSNKKNLNRQTIDAFADSVRSHYNNDFIGKYVESELESLRKSGKALTADVVLDTDRKAHSLFLELETIDRVTGAGAEALKYAHQLITLGTEENQALFDSMHGDCAQTILRGDPKDFWPKTQKRLADVLSKCMQGQTHRISKDEIANIARHTLRTCLVHHMSFDGLCSAAINAVSDRIGYPFAPFSHTPVQANVTELDAIVKDIDARSQSSVTIGEALSEHPYLSQGAWWVEQLNGMLVEAKLQHFSIDKLERHFHQIVTDMVRDVVATSTQRAGSPHSRSSMESISSESSSSTDSMPALESPEGSQVDLTSFVEVELDRPGRRQTDLTITARTLLAAFPPSMWQEPVPTLLRMTSEHSAALEEPLRAVQDMMRGAGEYTLVADVALRTNAGYLGIPYQPKADTDPMDLPPDEGEGSWDSVHSPGAIAARQEFLTTIFGNTPEEAQHNARVNFPAMRAVCREMAAMAMRETQNVDKMRQAVFMMACTWGPLNSSENPHLMGVPWFTSLGNHFLPDCLYRHAAFPSGSNGRFGIPLDEPALIQAYTDMAKKVGPTMRAFFDALME